MIQGYKQTEVGEIPESWDAVKIKDITVKVQDGNYGESYPKAEELLQKGVPFITSSALAKNYLDVSKVKFISEKKHNELLKAHIKEGDVLLTNRGANVGKCGITPPELNDANIGPQVTLLRCDKYTFNNLFLYQTIKSDIFQTQITKATGGSAMSFLNLKVTNDFSVPLPPLAEQQKIAEILTTVDEKIDVIDEQIAQTQELKKGLMQRLLAKGIGHTTFKDSELGEIPESWNMMKMHQVCTKITDGTHDTPKPVDTGIPFITAINVKDGFVDFKSCLFLPVEIHNEIYRRCNPEKGDVLIVNIGAGTATPAFISADFQFSLKNVALLKPKRDILDGKYLESYQLYKKEDIKNRLLSGGAQPFLSLKALSELDIVIPPISEQQYISRVFSSVDEKLTVLQEKKAGYQELKKGLMQQLLIGKIRVNHLIETEVFA